MNRNLYYFDPLPPLWTILLYKAYVVIWTFGKPPPPAMSTWFMNDPLAQNLHYAPSQIMFKMCYSGHYVLRLLCVLVLKRDFLSELFTTIGQCQLVWFPFAWSLFKDSSSWQKVLLFFTVSFIFDCCQVSRIMYRLRCIILLPSEI